MRRYLPLALALIATAAACGAEPVVVASSPTALPLQEPAASRLPKRLSFDDEFNGGRIDTGKWPRIGCFRFCGHPRDETLALATGEGQHFDPEAVVPDRRAGVVHLQIGADTPAERARWTDAIAHDASLSPGERARLLEVKDHGGAIHTYPNYPFTPGSLLEARVKLPTGCKGRWPALWGFAYPNPAKPGVPFAGQELDVLEGNGQGHLKITIHNTVSPPPSVEVRHPDGWFVERVWRDQAGRRIYAWIDGKLVAVLPAGNDNDVAMPVMASIAGGTPKWAFIGMPDAGTPALCEMQVDYIRIYS